MGQPWQHETIIFKGLSGSKALRKFISRHAEQWLNNVKAYGFSDAAISYRVEFERREGSSGILCQAMIQCDGEKTWVAAEWARTPEEAFHKCINSFGKKGLSFDNNRILLSG